MFVDFLSRATASYLYFCKATPFNLFIGNGHNQMAFVKDF